MIFLRTSSSLALCLCLAAALTGCQSTRKPATQPANPEAGAVPAATLQHAATLIQLTGGDLGVGGGFLIAASREKLASHAEQQALAAAHNAEQFPAQSEQVHAATTADLNNDGFVTLDEVLAMARVGMNDDEIVNRLRKTGYVFHITPQQERYLTDRGVSQKAVVALHELGQTPLNPPG